MQPISFSKVLLSVAAFFAGVCAVLDFDSPPSKTSLGEVFLDVYRFPCQGDRTEHGERNGSISAIIL